MYNVYSPILRIDLLEALLVLLRDLIPIDHLFIVANLHEAHVWLAHATKFEEIFASLEHVRRAFDGVTCRFLIVVEGTDALIDLFYILGISLEFMSHDACIHSFQFMDRETRIGQCILINELFLCQLPLGWYFGIVIKCIQKD